MDNHSNNRDEINADIERKKAESESNYSADCCNFFINNDRPMRLATKFFCQIKTYGQRAISYAAPLGLLCEIVYQLELDTVHHKSQLKTLSF